MNEQFTLGISEDGIPRLIDKKKGRWYPIKDTEENVKILIDRLNELSEDVEKEKEKYSQLFENYWDLKKKLNRISNVIYEYDNRIKKSPPEDGSL